MGLYADRERGKYAVWQSLDHKDFLPGSGIIFVTVTVSSAVPLDDTCLEATLKSGRLF